MVHCSTVHVLFYRRRISLCTSTDTASSRSTLTATSSSSAATMEVLFVGAAVSLAKLLSILGDVLRGGSGKRLLVESSTLLLTVIISLSTRRDNVVQSATFFTFCYKCCTYAVQSPIVSVRSFRGRSTHAVRLPLIALGRSTDRIVAVQSQYTRATVDRA